MDKFRICHIITECLLFLGLFFFCFNINSSLKRENIILKQKNKKLQARISNLESILGGMIDPEYLNNSDEVEDEKMEDEKVVKVVEVGESSSNKTKQESIKKKRDTKTPIILDDEEYFNKHIKI